MPEHSKTSRPMLLEGPYATERARLDGTFTDADRQWRKTFLKDQELAPNEPRYVPELNRMNPIRRAYRYPLDLLFSKLEPSLGAATPYARYWTGKLLLCGVGVLASIYYFKYNAHDWTRKKGFMMYTSRTAVYPGMANFPSVSKKTPADYADYGFKNSPI